MDRDLSRYLRRYTTLSSALDTLLNKRLVLLSPAKWDDQNDVRFMELYRASSQIGSVLALCFARTRETYHHWRVFTQGMEGVCLEFHHAELSHTVNSTLGVEARNVDYLLVRELKELTPADLERLPFVKRDGYKDEREWRIIAHLEEEAVQTKPLPIDITAISRVILNPWMPPPLAKNLREIIKGLPGCGKLKIEASRLTNSDEWKAAGSRVANLR